MDVRPSESLSRQAFFSIIIICSSQCRAACPWTSLRAFYAALRDRRTRSASLEASGFTIVKALMCEECGTPAVALPLRCPSFVYIRLHTRGLRRRFVVFGTIREREATPRIVKPSRVEISRRLLYCRLSQGFMRTLKHRPEFLNTPFPSLQIMERCACHTAHS